MKPGLKPFATNDTWSTGDQTGVTNKAETSVGEYNQGLKRNMPVHSQTWNDWRWRCEQIIQRIGSLKVCNFFQENSNGLAVINDGAGQYNYEDYLWGTAMNAYDGGNANVFHTLVSTNKDATAGYPTREQLRDEQQIWITTSGAGGGAATPSFDYGTGGIFDANFMTRWIPSTGNPSPAVTHPLAGANFGNMYLTGFSTNQSNDRAICYNHMGVASNGGIFYSGNMGWWTYWSGTIGTAGRSWGAIHHNKNNLWVAHDDTNNRLYSAPTLGNTWTQRSTAATGTGISMLWHTHHEANDLYYGDPGNPYWIFMGGSKAAGAKLKSTNGTSWSTLTTAGETITPLCENFLRYSKINQRWVILNTRSIANNAPTVIYSEDNGANWTAVEDAFGMLSESITSAGCGASAIETDSYGSWLINIQVNDGTNEVSRFYASSDDGMTWQRVFTNQDDTGEASTNDLGTAVWYGNGVFSTAQIGSIAGAAQAVQRFSIGMSSEE